MRAATILYYCNERFHHLSNLQDSVIFFQRYALWTRGCTENGPRMNFFSTSDDRHSRRIEWVMQVMIMCTIALLTFYLLFARFVQVIWIEDISRRMDGGSAHIASPRSNQFCVSKRTSNWDAEKVSQLFILTANTVWGVWRRAISFVCCLGTSAEISYAQFLVRRPRAIARMHPAAQCFVGTITIPSTCREHHCLYSRFFTCV